MSERRDRAAWWLANRMLRLGTPWLREQIRLTFHMGLEARRVAAAKALASLDVMEQQLQQAVVDREGGQ